MSPLTAIVIVFIQLYGFTFLIYLPYICKDWAYSPLFSGDGKLIEYVKTAVAVNDRRYSDAQMYFATFDETREVSELINNGNDTSILPTELVIGILTSKRILDPDHKYNLGYITQSLAGIHKAIQHDTNFKSKMLIVCNVDLYPDDYIELAYLKTYAKIYTKYTHGSSLQDDAKEIDEFEKHKRDYIFCLEMVSQYSPKYAIILEDDAIPQQHFFQTLHHHLSTNLKLQFEEGHISHTMKWAFIKLFYPDKWRGYSNSLHTILELCGIFIIGGGITTLLFNLLSLVLTKFKLICTVDVRIMRHRTVNITYILLIAGGLYVALVCYYIGRVYVMNWLSDVTGTHKLLTPAPGCCTQATLYPGYIITELRKYLSNIKCNIDYSHDLAIDEFAMHNKYQTFTVEPNMVRHIGMISGIRAWAKNAAEYIF